VVHLVVVLLLAGIGSIGVRAGHLYGWVVIALGVVIGAGSAAEQVWERLGVRAKAEQFSTDAKRALVVSLLDEQWTSFRHKARFLRIKYQVANRTVSPIQIENFKWEGTGLRFGVDTEVSQERDRIGRECPPPTPVVPAKGRIQGCYVVDREYGPGKGEPEYSLSVHSAVGGHEYGFRRLANPKKEIKR
jgi:hypothetical protein